ncbi:hypothetical protein ACFVQB_14360 [Paenibacillus sp. NPDC057886]|uniref:hypothetical protein n=1 Tax=Paenibacillus sp. NPDC057886 TaxID=3346270 RepID=UPI0036C8590F
MSKKGGEILVDLWSRVDQADYDLMIEEAFRLLPTTAQKRFIAKLLDNDRWDLAGEPNEEEKFIFRNFVNT